MTMAKPAQIRMPIRSRTRPQTSEPMIPFAAKESSSAGARSSKGSVAGPLGTLCDAPRGLVYAAERCGTAVAGAGWPCSSSGEGSTRCRQQPRSGIWAHNEFDLALGVESEVG
jgi:hypothetical protein